MGANTQIPPCVRHRTSTCNFVAAILREQVDRMLRDPKSRALTTNFTGQWLDLRKIDFTQPDKTLYPEFDPLLQKSMVAETHAFFQELLDHDLSVSNVWGSG